jgi:hypothetical protein
MNKPNKPFCLDYEEASVEIFNAISQSSQAHNIPFYLLENIILNVLTQIREGKRNELEMARQSYEQQLQAYTQQNDSTEE